MIEPMSTTPGKVQIPIRLPGNIVGADGEQTVIIEMPRVGLNVIDAKRLSERCPGMADADFDDLIDRLERMATCEIIRSAIKVRFNR